MTRASAWRGNKKDEIRRRKAKKKTAALAKERRQAYNSLVTFGGKEEDIPELVKNLCYGDGRDGTISGFVTLNEDDCTKIYQAMI